MSFPGDRPELRTLLAEELGEACETLERVLLALEAGDRDGLDEGLRVLHSLKGSANATGVRQVARVAHELETVLGEVRGERLEAGGERISMLLGIIDELAAARPAVRDGTLSDTALTSLVAALDPSAAGSMAGGPTPPGPAVGESPARVPEAATPEASDHPGPAARTVRVSAARLQELVSASGELATVRHLVADLALELRGTRIEAQQQVSLQRRRGGPVPVGATATAAGPLEGLTARLERLDQRLRGVSRLTSRVATTVQDAALSTALLPFQKSVTGFARTVRDVAEAVGVEADLRVEGAEVEVDRRVVATLRDPLLHLLRNAVAHGIEPPATRRERGKPVTGRVHLGVHCEAGELVVEVADDGGGIDFAAVRRARRSLQPADEVGAGDPGAVDAGDEVEEDDVELLFLAGLSTAPEVTGHAGRGVGLDVVRRQVEGVGGRVSIASQPGAGTRVTLRTPITLSTMRVLLVTLGGETLAVLASPVARVARVRAEEMVTVGDRAALPTASGPVPLLPLAGAFGADAVGAEEGTTRGASELALLVANGEGEVGLLVDRVIDDRDVLVTPLGPRLEGLSLTVGTTALSDGRRILVVHPVAVARHVAERAPAAGPPAVTAGRTRRILVAEDTPTTRALERSVLEAAGYEAVAVADGAEALAYLENHDVDLVVTDVGMPRVDGIELCATLRRTARWQDLPVVLVTSFDAEEDRRRGLEAGADAYLGKADFDRDRFLRTIGGLL